MSSHLVVLVLVKRHRNNGSDDIVLSLCTMYSTICQTVIVLLNYHHTLLRSSFFKTLVNDRIAPKQAKESILIPYNYSCNVRRCFLNTHKYLNFHALLFFRERIPSSSSTLFIIGQPINSKVLFKRPCRPFNMFYCYRSSKDYKRKQK